MSDYSVILDVGNTLKTVLWDHMDADGRIHGPILNSKNEITLASPDKLQTGSDEKLSLYLYRIIENPFLKNREMQSNDPLKINDAPLTLDLFYLVTPGSGDIEKDQLLLGKVMQVFHDNIVIAGSVLEGDALRGAVEKLRLQLYPLPFEESVNLWQSFSAKSFQLSVCYQVTPITIDSLRERSAQRVTEKEDRSYQKPRKPQKEGE